MVKLVKRGDHGVSYYGGVDRITQTIMFGSYGAYASQNDSAVSSANGTSAPGESVDSPQAIAAASNFSSRYFNDPFKSQPTMRPNFVHHGPVTSKGIAVDPAM